MTGQAKPAECSPPLFDLNQMIAQENDQRYRILLMLVQQGNESWAENTRAVKENAAAVTALAKDLEALFTSFEERSRADDALKNQGKGAGRAIMAIIGAVQLIGLWIWTDTRDDLRGIHDAITVGQRSDATIEVRLRALEASLTKHTP